MDNATTPLPPNRVTDLVNLKQLGYDLDIDLRFEIVPVDFAQGDAGFQAYIFLARFRGTLDGQPFGFRKCYAKGCPHNLCPHVAQAVMIANRYLARDYKKLEAAGIRIPETYFTLEEMVTGYDKVLVRAKNEKVGGILTIHDYIRMAREGTPVRVGVCVETMPGVEHFAGSKRRQTFLNADFDITAFGNESRFQRCVACFDSENEAEEKPLAVTTANNRLKLLFAEFDAAHIRYTPCYFA